MAANLVLRTEAGRQRRTISVLALVVGFSVLWPLALSVFGFPMVDIISSLYGVRDFDIERVKLVNGVHLGILFNLVPLAALLTVWLLPIRPLKTPPRSPIIRDLTETFRFLVTVSLVTFTAAITVLRLAGVINGDNAPGVILSFFTTAVMAYAILLPDQYEDGKPMTRVDQIVIGSLLLFCVLLSKRELILLAVPLLAVRGVRADLLRIGGFVAGAAGVAAISALARANLDLAQTALRLLGDQYKFLERYATSYGIFDTCFGPATLVPFLNRGRYAEFYQFTRDPIQLLAGGRPIYWDSSSLLERLNFAFCSEEMSFLLYFLALVLLLAMEKTLGDGRFRRTALILIIFSFESFSFYNAPSLVILTLALASGVWRILSTILQTHRTGNVWEPHQAKTCTADKP